MKKKRTTTGNRKARGKTPAAKPYWEMTTAELREATKEFDQEFIGDTFGPPTAEQRAKTVVRVANAAGRATAWGPRRSPSRSRNDCWPRPIGWPRGFTSPVPFSSPAGYKRCSAKRWLSARKIEMQRAGAVRANCARAYRSCRE